MLKYFCFTLIILSCSTQLFSQDFKKNVLAKTKGHTQLIKVVNLNNSTTAIFKVEAIKGPGGFRVLADIIEEQGTRHLVVSTPSQHILKVKDIFVFNDQILFICMHVSKKDKKEVYTAHYFDMHTGRLSEPVELFRQNILKGRVARIEAVYACSPNQQYLSVFHPTEQIVTDKYSINISTFDASLGKISTISDKGDFSFIQSSFKKLVIDNMGRSHLLFSDFSQAPSQFSYVESSRYTQYRIYSYDESGKLTDGITIRDEPITYADMEVRKDGNLILAGLQGSSTLTKDYVIGMIAFKLDPSNGDTELLLDSKLSLDYIRAHVSHPNKLLKNGELDRMYKVKIILYNDNTFSIFSERSISIDNSTRNTDILICSVQPNSSYTHIISRNPVSTKADFAYLNGKLIGLMFSSAETYFRQDLILLSVGEEVEKKKVLSREESIEIKSGNVHLIQLENYSKVLFFAQKSPQESILYTITMD